MKEKRDYVSYLIGIGSLFLTILSFFKDESQKLLFLIWGAAGMVVAVVMIYINKYVGKVEEIEMGVEELKREYKFSEQVRNLRQEIDSLKKNKKGKQTDLEDLLKIGFLIIIIYLILKALGVIK